MTAARGQVDDAITRTWQWMRSDPRNMTAVLSLPVVVAELVSEWRWHRDNGVPWFSHGGTVAYVKARPLRAALSLVVTVLPEIVAVIATARRSRHR